MPITPTSKIWMNGELVDWDDAKIHVLTHSLHYGMGVFEGIRAYETSQGPGIFRLTEHIERLFNSAKIMGMDIPYTVDEIIDATKAVVRESGLPSAYIRLNAKDVGGAKRGLRATCLRCQLCVIFVPSTFRHSRMNAARPVQPLAETMLPSTWASVGPTST